MRHDVHVGHPDFGEAFPCECTQRAHDEWLRARYDELFRTTWRSDYHAATLADFRSKPGLVAQVAAALDANRGLYIWSQINGTGKTHLAMAILRDTWGELHGKAFLVAELLADIRRSYDPESGVVPEDVLAEAVNAPLLVLDDFGAENPTTWARETLFRLIFQRAAEHTRKLTIITSNYSLGQLEGRLKEGRVPSRIAGMCDVVEMTGADRRLQR